MKKILLSPLSIFLFGCDAFDCGESMDVARANYAAANLNVARDADMGHIVLFSTTPGNTIREEMDEFVVTVLFDSAIEKHHRKWSGAYHNHHNGIALRFAAAHAEEKPDLFKRVIYLLKEHTPDYEWSHPTLGDLPIQEIVERFENSPERLDEFFEAAKLNWERQRPAFQQGGAGQPATRPEADSEGADKLQPESDGPSR